MTVIACTVYAALTIFYLLAGRLNGDEAWFLYAGKVVYRGELPYHDFAFTQMPLLPYVYGPVQLAFGPSMLLGRITSASLSFAAMILIVLTASRYGRMAAAVAAILAAAFAQGIYFHSIVKTYPLVTLCFALTLWILTSRMRDGIKYPLAVLASVAAAEVRLSAACFAAVVVVYSLLRTRTPTRLAIAAVLCLAAVPTGWLLLSDLPSSSWSLVGHHVSHWGDITLGGKVGRVVWRAYGLAQFLDPLLLPVIGSCIILLNRRQNSLLPGDSSFLVVSVVAVAAFCAIHLPSGWCVSEYFTPAVFALLPAVSLCFERAWDQATSAARKVLIALLILAVGRLMAQGVGPPSKGGPLLNVTWAPLAAVNRAGDFLASHTGPRDKVLAFEGLAAVVNSDRLILPGLSTAWFVGPDLPTAQAKAVRVINTEMLLDYLRERRAAAVVLTNVDLQEFPQLKEALPAAGYRVALRVGDNDDRLGTWEVYLLTEQSRPVSGTPETRPSQ